MITDFYQTNDKAALMDFLPPAYDWDYEEREGTDTRFDWNGRSMWVREDGSVEGQVPPTLLKKLLKKKMIEVVVL